MRANHITRPKYPLLHEELNRSFPRLLLALFSYLCDIKISRYDIAEIQIFYNTGIWCCHIYTFDDKVMHSQRNSVV